MNQDLKIISGKWSGTYLDVKGHRGNLDMELSADNDGITGRYTVTIKDTDAPQIYRGEITGIKIG